MDVLTSTCQPSHYKLGYHKHGITFIKHSAAYVYDAVLQQILEVIPRYGVAAGVIITVAVVVHLDLLGQGLEGALHHAAGHDLRVADASGLGVAGVCQVK